jgi:diguanylate cyclase (GGDEF)-like protein
MVVSEGMAGHNRDMLAVFAVFGLLIASGIAFGLSIIVAARTVDGEALARQEARIAPTLAAMPRSDAAELAEAGRTLRLDGLAWFDAASSRRPGAMLQIAGPDGTPRGLLGWNPERPGARLLALALPGVLAAAGLLAAAAATAVHLTLAGFARIAREKARAEHLANCDHLTGLANRRAFERRLAEAAGRGEAFALLAVDLDHFKTLNDRFGHAGGDAALIAVARRLEAAAPAGATVARLGGDEFAVLSPGLAAEGALDLAAAVSRAIAEPCRIAGCKVRVGGSVGVACAPDHGVGTDELMRRADIALYEVKDAGRSFALMFEPAMEARAALRALRAA